ncbi:MAG: ATP-binding protein, partial [Oscillospiraceae bacterium]|nr:ATP-binding protein [Oscillospiraceae bacterium]
NEIYSDTGNIAFDSIINFKIKDVVANHINFRLNIFIPPVLNIEVADVVTILGNLLDNAFEAVANVEDKVINLGVEVNKGILFIKLENTFDGVVNYADGKSGTKTITSRKEGEGHGYGLRNIQKSIEKYDGQMDISHEASVFLVNILMYVEDIEL